MFGRSLFVGLLLMCSVTFAHEMTPTYPKLENSHLEGLYKTTMTVFNKREEVEYYEIGVFDKDFSAIPFVSSYTVIKIPYLSSVTFDVYIRKADRAKITYICSKSKLRKDDSIRTAISSKICSKVK